MKGSEPRDNNHEKKEMKEGEVIMEVKGSCN